MRKRLVILAFLVGFVLLPQGGFSQSFVGSWGYVRLSHSNSGEWSAETGKMVLNADGTGSLYNKVNNNGTLRDWETTLFTYSLSANPNGTQNITINFPGETVTVVAAISDDGKMMLIDGTTDLGQQIFLLLIRIDPSKIYGDSDLAGYYYGLGYRYLRSTNDFASWSSLANANGAGTTSQDYILNYNNTITLGTATGTYTVASDGYVDTPTLDGYLSGDGKLLVMAVADLPNNFSCFFYMKQADKTYTTADLAGTWMAISFGDEDKTSFNASFGSLICDAIGNCSVHLKNERDGTVNYNYSGASAISVASDGSFGSSFNPGSPSYIAAIGNNGNALVVNSSFNSTSPGHREIFVGLRCSACFFPYQLKLPLILKN